MYNSNSYPVLMLVLLSPSGEDIVWYNYVC
jgi:hypothetical protein